MQRSTDALIDTIYEAAADPARWNDVLSEIVLMVGASEGLIHTLRGDSVTVAAEHGHLDDELIEICETVYRNHNPWMKAILAGGPERGLINLDDHVPRTMLQNSGFYAEILRPQRQEHALGGVLYRKGDTQVTIYLGRSAEGGAFGETSIARIRPILPHLERAMALRAEWPTLIDGMTAILDLQPQGAMILTSTGKILFVNRSAQAILRRDQTLKVQNDRLRPMPGREGELLQALLTRACAGEPGGSVVFERSLDGPLVASLAPLRGQHAATLTGVGGRSGTRGAILLLREPLRELPMDQQLLVQIYGLTAAEARVMALLCAGYDAKDIGQSLGVKPSTIKSHLARLFAKTGTGRQAELIRLAANLPCLSHERSLA